MNSRAGEGARRSPRNTPSHNNTDTAKDCGDSNQETDPSRSHPSVVLSEKNPRSQSESIPSHNSSDKKLVVQLTTSRRGGKVSASIRRSPNVRRSATQDKFIQSGKESTMSHAAAAAADAAAKFLCDKPGEGGGISWYHENTNDDIFRRENSGQTTKFFIGRMNSEENHTPRQIGLDNDGYHFHPEHQSVFRSQELPNEGNLRIRTKQKISLKKPKTATSTVRVMGSHTATHIRYRQIEPLHHKNVFRETTFDDDMDGEHLLLSLKSGSKSFDLLGGNSTDKATKCEDHSDNSLSPEDPPRIHHAHHQASKPDSFLFEQKALKTPKSSIAQPTLESSPSFNLFNHSFDSFCDDPYLRSPPTGGGTFLDSSPRPSLSFPHGGYCSPRKSSFLPSPITHSSPLKTNAPSHESDDDGSLDDAIDKSMSGGSSLRQNDNTMVLPVSKTVNKIPIVLETPHVDNLKPSVVERLGGKMFAPSNESRIDNVGPHQRLPVAPQHHRRIMMHPSSAPPVSSSLRDSTLVGHEASHFVGQHTPNRYSVPVSCNYTRLPSAAVQQTQISDYRPKKRPTSLVGMDASTIYDRLSCHQQFFGQFEFLLPIHPRQGHRMKDRFEIRKDDLARPRVYLQTMKNEQTCDIVDDKTIFDRLIARRRVVSALCAFGGNGSSYKNSFSISSSTDDITQKGEHDFSTIIQRFYEHDNRISWEVEENSPVQIPSSKRKLSLSDEDNKTPKKSTSVPPSMAITPENAVQPKMRYRCKLCGLPKQNHKCRFQKSIQRSIGVNVYSAANAFNADEPGEIAPALSEVNNFIPSDLVESTPSRTKSTVYTFSGQGAPLPLANVTPETIRSNGQTVVDAMASTASRLIRSPMRPMRRKKILSPDRNQPSPRHQSEGLESDFVFRESMQLRQEQFRQISSNNNDLKDFSYPAIPLPYAQRKSLADNLFQLSREMPSLTDDCAQILRRAREIDKWDVAVAELLTQVLCIIHCPVDDLRLEGLSRYLLSFGFSC